MADTIFQNWVFVDYALPFILIFVLVFAILQKTKLLGEDKKQIDALVALVIAILFVSIGTYKDLAKDLVLFLAIGMVVILVGMLLFGFLYGGEVKFSANKYLSWVAGFAVLIAVVIVILISTNSFDRVYNFLFKSSLSNTIWANVIFILGIVIALAIALKK